MGYERKAMHVYRPNKKNLVSIYVDSSNPFLYFCQTEYYNDDYIRRDMKLLLYI